MFTLDEAVAAGFDTSAYETSRPWVDLDLAAFVELADAFDDASYADGCCLCAPGDACYEAEAAACAPGEFSLAGFAACDAALCDQGCVNALVATCDAKGRCGDGFGPGCKELFYGEHCANQFNASVTILLGWLTLLLSLCQFPMATTITAISK